MEGDENGINLDLNIERVTCFGDSKRLWLIEFYDSDKIMIVKIQELCVVVREISEEKMPGPRKGEYSYYYNGDKPQKALLPADRGPLEYSDEENLAFWYI